MDSLEDFVDEVEDQFWDRNLSESLFTELTKRGMGILPRERRHLFEIYGQSDFDWDNHQFIIYLGRERRKYPADSEEDRTIRSREIEYTHEFGNFTFSGVLERQETDYSKDPNSNKREYQRQIQGQMDLDTINLTGSHQFKRTTYPNASYKNRSLSKRSLEVGIGSNLTVSWENKHKVHPNNSYKDWMARETDIEAEFESGVSIGWETEQKNYPRDQVKDYNSRTLEVAVEKQLLEGTSFSISIENSDKNYPHNPYKNKDRVSFAATVGVEF